jgi:hypothetical protein
MPVTAFSTQCFSNHPPGPDVAKGFDSFAVAQNAICRELTALGTSGHNERRSVNKLNKIFVVVNLNQILQPN